MIEAYSLFERGGLLGWHLSLPWGTLPGQRHTSSGRTVGSSSRHWSRTVAIPYPCPPLRGEHLGQCHLQLEDTDSYRHMVEQK